MPQTILVVDDDPTQRRLLETVITKQGYQVRLVPGGREAVDFLSSRQAPVDLVMLDLVMPELDGMEVLETIRPRQPNLPIIVLTAHGGVDTVVKAMRAGATDFLVKPVGPERLKVTPPQMIQSSPRLKSCV